MCTSAACHIDSIGEPPHVPAAVKCSTNNPLPACLPACLPAYLLTHLAFCLSLQITGQCIEQHNPQLYRTTAQHLLLSREQQQRIATTLRLFREMTEPLLRARAKLQGEPLS
jgi:hypothetical protein